MKIPFTVAFPKHMASEDRYAMNPLEGQFKSLTLNLLLKIWTIPGLDTYYLNGEFLEGGTTGDTPEKYPPNVLGLW